jgi:sialate O-acetylesterase
MTSGREPKYDHRPATLRVRLLLTAAAVAVAVDPAFAGLKMPAVFGDHMVVQRDVPVPVWGWGDADAGVTVEWRDVVYTTIVDKSGRWTLSLPPSSAGGPVDLSVTSGAQTIRIKDVMVGEVWLCSGQSNMEWPVHWSGNYDAERAAADRPTIRMITIPHAMATRPQSDVVAEWKVCTTETVGTFSATAYFFGRELQSKLNVPIGLVHSSWGGTRIEPWISRSTLEKDTEFRRLMHDVDREIATFEAIDPTERKKQAARHRQEYEQAVTRYWSETAKVDPGIKGRWHAPSLDNSQWQDFPLTSTWENAGVDDLKDFDGSVWLRIEVDIPESWAGREVVLRLPPIDDSDTTFFNGVMVGRTTARWYDRRNYTIRANAVRPGRSVIAIQAIDYRGAGGFGGSLDDIRKQLYLEAMGDVQPKKVPLTGPWRYRVAAKIADLPELPPFPQIPTHPGERNTTPTVLYNAMIYPLAPYAIRGAIWYQGESNASEPVAYRKLLPMLIDSWRDRWNQPEPNRVFPFGVVQLANFMQDRPNEPAPGGWAWLREAQLLAAMHHPNTGLAVTIDIGEARDIHPKNKQEVGRRLSLWALATAYGFDIAYSGPVYRKMERKDGRIVLHFDHAGVDLATRDRGPLRGFAIAGEDRKFHWAEARIDGTRVIVESKDVPNPVAVRYAWADNPATANLVNQAGLPASPFRTDDWPAK